MPSTLKYAITYPAGNVAPNVPLAMQSTAESTESAIKGVETKNRHAEYTTAAVAATANSARAVGAVTVDAAKTFNNTFATPGTAAGDIKILEAGTYSIDFVLLPTTSPGSTGLQIVGSSASRVTQAFNNSYLSWETTAVASNVYLAANEVLTFTAMLSTSQNIGARIRITKLHG